jgi:hypothetical protein
LRTWNHEDPQDREGIFTHPDVNARSAPVEKPGRLAVFEIMALPEAAITDVAARKGCLEILAVSEVPGEGAKGSAKRFISLSIGLP